MLPYSHFQKIVYIFNAPAALGIIGGTEYMVISQSGSNSYEQFILKLSAIV